MTTIASVEVNPFRCTLTELRPKRQAKAGGIELSMEQIIALADIDRALWWVLSQLMHTAPSPGEVTLLPKVLDTAEQFRPLSANEQADVIGSQRPPMPRLGIFAAA